MTRYQERRQRELRARQSHADEGVTYTELFYRMAYYPTKRELAESMQYLASEINEYMQSRGIAKTGNSIIDAMSRTANRYVGEDILNCIK